ncbi:MAG: SDR family oxidoreductase [Halobacteriovoraceae bacterium]|jgi:NAD(P)-dependent dehydrogenase (short-subunit alcohol dehydrogenase family)|nr:SDR family oxidoreductase [Halobacteriovoraceae bacterium]
MNKVAIVLGTSSGLGLACASSLLERGFLVYGGSRSESTLVHDNFVDLEIDITQEKHIRNFINEVKAESDVVDVLVNAAGMCDMKSITDSTALDMRMHLETNVIGYFNFLKQFEPLILADETHLINLFSISAKRFFPNTCSYSSAEFARKGMLGVFEKEWKKYQIRFSNLFVGAVDTPLWQDYSEIDTSKMLTTDEFLYIFNSIVDAPLNIQFPEMTFLHRDGFLD